MEYFPFAKNLSIVLFVVLAPIYMLIKLKSEAIPYIIVFFQIVLVWTQIEISLRQHVLLTAQFEPFFEVTMKNVPSDIPALTVEPEIECASMDIRNVSKNPAYNLRMAGIYEDINHISEDRMKNVISQPITACLAPDQKTNLCFLRDAQFFKDKTIDVSYHNQFGEYRKMGIFLYEGGNMILPAERQNPGILLNSFDCLNLFFKMLQRK